MKKVWNLISSIFVWLLVALAACMCVFTVVSLRTVDARERNLFGYKAYIVQSDSMSATDFAAGDLIFVKEVDPSALQPGDIIAFTSRNSHNLGETVTHKIRSLTEDESGAPGFVTYGTTTGTDDETVVTYDAVLGKYVGRIPELGVFFTLLKTPKGYISLILIPFLLMIGYSLFNCIRMFRNYRKQEDDAYKAAIEAEKEKNEQMRRELEELRAMISGKKTAQAEKAPAPEKTAAPAQAKQTPPANRKQPARQPRTVQQMPPSRKHRPADYDELDLENIIAEFSPRRNPKL